MDDIAEQHEITNEIKDAISNPLNIGGCSYMDDDDLLRELEELEEKVLDILGSIEELVSQISGAR